MDIDDYIEYESENTNLDFKATEYKKEQYFELLKDVIAMANANSEVDKFIITGVKKYPDGEFKIVPIDTITDSAIYQRLILDNIEPDIHIEYNPHLYKNEQLVGVLKISPTIDKPYMMKKNYGNDKQSRRTGEMFIRKGTTSSVITRKDLDKIFETKKAQDAFSHNVTFYFSGTSKSKLLDLQPVKIHKLPSEIEADEIKSVIRKKEEEKKKRIEQEERKKIERQKIIEGEGFVPPIMHSTLLNLEVLRHTYSPFGTAPQPYEKRSIETLYDDLKHVEEIYSEDDDYYINIKYANKINIYVLNEGSKYLKDAVVKVEIPDIYGLVIADKIYRKPIKEALITKNLFDIDNNFYPKFKKENGHYVYDITLGDLRHLQPIKVFNIPILVNIGPDLAGSEIEVKLTLFGENLPNPIKDSLRVKVNSQEIIQYPDIYDDSEDEDDEDRDEDI